MFVITENIKKHPVLFFFTVYNHFDSNKAHFMYSYTYKITSLLTRVTLITFNK